MNKEAYLNGYLEKTGANIQSNMRLIAKVFGKYRRDPISGLQKFIPLPTTEQMSNIPTSIQKEILAKSINAPKVSTNYLSTDPSRKATVRTWYNFLGEFLKKKSRQYIGKRFEFPLKTETERGVLGTFEPKSRTVFAHIPSEYTNYQESKVDTILNTLAHEFGHAYLNPQERIKGHLSNLALTKGLDRVLGKVPLYKVMASTNRDDQLTRLGKITPGSEFMADTVAVDFRGWLKAHPELHVQVQKAAQNLHKFYQKKELRRKIK